MYSQTISFLSKTYYLADFIVFWTFVAVFLFALAVVIGASICISRQNRELKSKKQKRSDEQSAEEIENEISEETQEQISEETDIDSAPETAKVEDEPVCEPEEPVSEENATDNEPEPTDETAEEQSAEEVENEVPEETQEQISEETDMDSEPETVESEEAPVCEPEEPVSEENVTDDEPEPTDETAEEQSVEEVENEVPEETQEQISEETDIDSAPENVEVEDEPACDEATVKDGATSEPIENEIIQSTKRDLHLEVKDGFVFFDAYSRSFISKLIQSDKRIQNYYGEIKNKLLSYRKVHDRLSWRAESYRLGRKLMAMLSFRGRTLCLYLALDPDEYNPNVYHQRDYRDKKRYASVPMMVKVRSDLGLKRALNLVDILLKDIALNKKFEKSEYFYEYLSDETLLDDGLIKLIRMKRPVEISENETSEDALNRVIDELAQQDETPEVEEDVDLFEENEAQEEISFDAPEELETLPEVETVVEPEETVSEKPVAPIFEEKEEVEHTAEKVSESEKQVPDFDAPEELETLPEVETVVEPEETVSEKPVAPIFEEKEEVEHTAEKVSESEKQVPDFDAPEELETLPEVETVAEPEEKDSKKPVVPTFEEKEEVEHTAEKVSERKKQVPDFSAPEELETLPEVETVAEPEEKDSKKPVAPTFEEKEEIEHTAEKVSERKKQVPDFSAPEELETLPEIKTENCETRSEPKAKEPAPDFEEKDYEAPVIVRRSKPDVEDETEIAEVPDELTSLPEIERKDVKREDRKEPSEREKEKVVFEDHSSTLPKGLYDDVPEKKVKKDEPKQSENNALVIPEGLTDEEKRRIAENEELLKQLMENESDDEEHYDIVGICTDPSGFNAFETKMYNAPNNIKYYYSELKNTLLSYKKIKCKQSNAGDSFRQGNNLVARITYNGNKLRLHLALNPKDYSVNEYNHYSLINVNAYKEVPLTLEISMRGDLINASKLIQDAMGGKFVVYLDKKREYVDYAAYYTKKED